MCQGHVVKGSFCSFLRVNNSAAGRGTCSQAHSPPVCPSPPDTADFACKFRLITETLPTILPFSPQILTACDGILAVPAALLRSSVGIPSFTGIEGPQEAEAMSASIFFIAFISEELLAQNEEAALSTDQFFGLAAEMANVTVIRLAFGAVPLANFRAGISIVYT